MTSNEIRKQFLEFFKERRHKIIPSSPVVPYNDPTLLFTNAGMNQFKDIFLGTGTRNYKRAADTQKCIRVSGKHNDLEEVGYDTYHHTFFEMLGNWSFGDYYKKETIVWAWELLTEIWKMPKERLWATVYKTDDEAFDLWQKETDINPKHILRFGKKDNFWEMGNVGPCGPSSEIHINIGNDYDNPEWVNAGDPQCIEIWNLVFIQYNKDTQGNLLELPAKHVDTGMGLERVCAVLQNKASNYDTDIFKPLIESIENITGIKYEKEEHQIAMRVIADHIRTLTFAIADGAVPSNEGRGYVLRRILRRAARYGRKLNLNRPFLYRLVNIVVENMYHVFPEIKNNQTDIEKIIKSEEENFNITLDRGIALFEQIAQKSIACNNNLISGDDVFKLYDTFGFPIDLTNIMAKEKKLKIDKDRFNELMNMQKERARKSTKDKLTSVNLIFSNTNEFDLNKFDETQFVGYDTLSTDAKILTLKSEKNRALLILDQSPFYAEAGGQAGDTGKIIFEKNELNLIELIKINNRIIHVVENKNNLKFAPGQKVIAEVNRNRRWDIMRNHSATHFLNAALRQILGTHVKQSGSYVGPDRLRFDFTHFAKLTENQIIDVEKLVNEKLRENLPLIHHRNIPFEEAKKMNALMFFGDKYGDKVNVVQFGNFTMEFCGGTHVSNSSQIGLLKILSESSIASGIRRIEAVTGAGVEAFIYRQLGKVKETNEKLENLINEKKKLEKELAELKLKEKFYSIKNIVASPSEVKGINVFKGEITVSSMNELKSLGDELRIKMKSGVGLLISDISGKAAIVCVVSDDLIKNQKLMAGKIVGLVAKIVDGGGGGKPHLATAGGKNVLRIPDALNRFDEILSKLI